MEPSRTGGGSRRYSQSDIDLLRRIQELTNEGLNLVGVQRVMELERRLMEAQAENEAAASRPSARSSHPGRRRGTAAGATTRPGAVAPGRGAVPGSPPGHASLNPIPRFHPRSDARPRPDARSGTARRPSGGRARCS
ncbi:MAG: MerR family transcriptional regulator [Microthrixaceae bacterium]